MNLKIDQNISSTPNKQLTNDRWRAILQALLENYEEGILKRRTIKEVAVIANVEFSELTKYRNVQMNQLKEKPPVRMSDHERQIQC